MTATNSAPAFNKGLSRDIIIYEIYYALCFAAWPLSVFNLIAKVDAFFGAIALLLSVLLVSRWVKIFRIAKEHGLSFAAASFRYKSLRSATPNNPERERKLGINIILICAIAPAIATMLAVISMSLPHEEFSKIPALAGWFYLFAFVFLTVRFREAQKSGRGLSEVCGQWYLMTVVRQERSGVKNGVVACVICLSLAIALLILQHALPFPNPGRMTPIPFLFLFYSPLRILEYRAYGRMNRAEPI